MSLPELGLKRPCGFHCLPSGRSVITSSQGCLKRKAVEEKTPGGKQPKIQRYKTGAKRKRRATSGTPPGTGADP